MQKQAAALSEKDATIAKLNLQLKQLKPHLPVPRNPRSSSATIKDHVTGTSSPRTTPRVLSATQNENASKLGASERLAPRDGDDEDGDWAHMPVPETLAEALEQILVLQVCCRDVDGATLSVALRLVSPVLCCFLSLAIEAVTAYSCYLQVSERPVQLDRQA
jgi:hypothetical protein